MGDDDMIYDIGFIEKGSKYFNEHTECGVLVGYTFTPWISEQARTMTEEMYESGDFDGTLEMRSGGYCHCVYYTTCCSVHSFSEPRMR
jgi:hypothetical protein